MFSSLAASLAHSSGAIRLSRRAPCKYPKSTVNGPHRVGFPSLSFHEITCLENSSSYTRTVPLNWPYSSIVPAILWSVLASSSLVKNSLAPMRSCFSISEGQYRKAVKIGGAGGSEKAELQKPKRNFEKSFLLFRRSSPMSA